MTSFQVDVMSALSGLGWLAGHPAISLVFPPVTRLMEDGTQSVLCSWLA